MGWGFSPEVFLHFLFYLEKSPMFTQLQMKENHDVFEVCRAVFLGSLWENFPARVGVAHGPAAGRLRCTRSDPFSSASPWSGGGAGVGGYSGLYRP